jgi:myo-inositol 2-dehydrogenase/D-chiro-inositol 1-dehydrogenase
MAIKGKNQKQITRRQVLKAAGGAGLISVFPSIVPSSVFGKHAPSNRINVAMIGIGRQAIYSNLPAFLHSDDTKVVAVCDVDEWRLDNAKRKVDEFYKNTDCKAYTDWREIIERDDVDAVMNSTSDQWHVPISLLAVRSGKHVSCEKPISLSIAEGRILSDAVKEQGVVFRTDTECRTNSYMHKAAELTRNGYFGKIKRIEVGVPAGDKDKVGNATSTPVPAEMDYEMWTGPAPMKPYSVDRVHKPQSYDRPGWMRCRTTCEGIITNWGTHLLDVAQLANNTERTGPVSVEGTGKFGSGIWDVLQTFNVHYQYANGVRLDYLTDRPYIRIEGDEGWIFAPWGGRDRLQAHDETILRIKQKDFKIQLLQREDKQDFIYAIKNNCNTMVDAEVGHRACSMGQIGHIAVQLGQKLNWDPTAEKFKNNDQANEMLKRTYRKPWDRLVS